MLITLINLITRFCVCAQNASDADIKYAFQAISAFASDMFEILKIDNAARQVEEAYVREQREKEEDESSDEVYVLDRKKKMSLRYKRSFFVRMVSDPKLYNPKIVKALGQTANRGDSEEGGDPGVVTPL